MTTKITKTTVKSFIKKNAESLFINVKRSFDGSTDCERDCNGGFQTAKETTNNANYTLGIQGAWFVGSSRDYFTAYQDENFTGIEVYNSCGCFILAVKN